MSVPLLVCIARAQVDGKSGGWTKWSLQGNLAFWPGGQHTSICPQEAGVGDPVLDKKDPYLNSDPIDHP